MTRMILALAVLGFISLVAIFNFTKVVIAWIAVAIVIVLGTIFWLVYKYTEWLINELKPRMLLYIKQYGPMRFSEVKTQFCIREGKEEYLVTMAYEALVEKDQIMLCDAKKSTDEKDDDPLVKVSPEGEQFLVDNPVVISDDMDEA